MNKILSIREVTNIKRKGESNWPRGYSGYAVRTEEGTLLFLIEDGQNCCETYGYIMSEDAVEDFVGANLLAVNFVDEACNVKTEEILKDSWIDKGSCCFINLETDQGTLQFVLYNEHNGYYSHSVYLQTLTNIEVSCL